MLLFVDGGKDRGRPPAPASAPGAQTRLFQFRRSCTLKGPTQRSVAALEPFPGQAACAGKEIRMWKKPMIVEIAVGLEINSYACAELD